MNRLEPTATAAAQHGTSRRDRQHPVTLALTALALLLSLAGAGQALAIDCWGKSSPAEWCSHHGRCVAFNNCQCDLGWRNNECQGPTFCVSGDNIPIETCNSDCNYPHGKCSQLGFDGVCFCAMGRAGSCCESLNTTGMLTPAAVDFGAVAAGPPGLVRTVTFTNPLPTESLTLDRITLSGANSADFAVDGSCVAGVPVAGGATCSIDVTLSPLATGNRSAILTVAVTSPATILTTFLTGTGTIATSSIIIDPATPATLYAGLDGAGIYKSTNSGTNWTPATTQPTNMRVKAVVIKPFDSTKLFAATYGGGVFKSTNSGVDWSVCKDGSNVENSGLTNLNVVSLTIDASGKLYAGTEAGVFVSTDDCANWMELNTGLPN